MTASSRPARLEPLPLPVGPPAGSEPGAGTGAENGEERRRLLGRVARAELRSGHQAIVLALLADLLDEPSLARALDALAGALQRRFGAERVAVALTGADGELRFAALSQQAQVELASAEVRLLLDAMEESCELERAVRFPDPGDSLGTLAAHRTLAGRRAGTTLASVPLYHQATLVGAVLLERRGAGAFTDRTLEFLERVALVVAPLLALRQDAERGVTERLRRQSGETLERWLGPTRPGLRLALGLAAVALPLALLVPAERHVSAAAELVPRERRLVTAPLDGFVDEVLVSSGERVERGQLLARLDRRELELELARRDSESASAEAELRAAMASHDRQTTAIARARLERERALRELVLQRLARAELRAPITGLIISGNPADAIGMPLARGETLFEIAPADGYEVHLLVDERDVHDVHEGQRGTLSLRASPGESRALIVRAVHPVAESGGGASRFRVRATFTETDGETLRPGQSGVARIEAGTSTLAEKAIGPLLGRLDELRWRLFG